MVDVGPLDDDEASLRHQLWLGTDRAYKAAAEALTAKQAELKKYTVDQPVDDFAHASEVQFSGPLVSLDFAPQPWLATLQEASALYKTDPAVQSLNASLRFTATTNFVNSKGRWYAVATASTGLCRRLHPGADGMRLDRARVPGAQPKNSQRRKRCCRVPVSCCNSETLREAQSVREYRGPVLFSADAASASCPNWWDRTCWAGVPHWARMREPSETGRTTKRAGCCLTFSPSWMIRRSQLTRGTVSWAAT